MLLQDQKKHEQICVQKYQSYAMQIKEQEHDEGLFKYMQSQGLYNVQ